MLLTEKREQGPVEVWLNGKRMGLFPSATVQIRAGHIYGCTISESSYIGCSQYLLVKAVKEKQSLMVRNIVQGCVGHPVLLEEGTAALVGWVKNLTAYVVKNIS